jgi:hypothetical protein
VGLTSPVARRIALVARRIALAARRRAALEGTAC